MKVINTILTLALLFGFLAERIVPCDGLIDLCGGAHEEAGLLATDSDVDHTHDNGSSGDHHDECNDCVCPCHAPVPPIEQAALYIADTYTDYPPSRSLHPIHAGARPPSPIPLS